MHDRYTGLTPEHFQLITSRYVAFQDACNDVSKEPVKVFNPLSKKNLDELQLIREVSKDLQRKKEEDVKRAAQVPDEEEVKETKEKQDEEEEKTETEK